MKNIHTPTQHVRWLDGETVSCPHAHASLRAPAGGSHQVAVRSAGRQLRQAPDISTEYLIKEGNTVYAYSVPGTFDVGEYSHAAPGILRECL